MTDFATTVKDDERVYSSEDYQYANSIINDIKRQQRLPLQLTVRDVFGVFETALGWWYEKYPDATQDDLLTFNVDVLNQPQKYLDAADVDKSFRILTNQVLMPPNVYGIYNCFYLSSGYVNRSLLNYANWSLEWLLLSSTFGSYPRMNVDTYMGSVFCLNLLNSLSKEPVRHKYNQDTHILQVYDLGYRVGYITAEVARMIPLQTMYHNPWFRKYVIAKVLDARADSIEIYGAQLPGDLQFNSSVLRNRASKLMEEVEKQLDIENASEFYAIKS
jgi:hypothetical protein